MKELQTRSEAKDYGVGTIHGILGINTRKALRQEQKRLGRR
jgi:hypothetical protein